MMDLTSQWYIAAQLRNLANQHNTDLPTYLLAYEIAAILEHTPDLQHRMLFELLFNCGGRVSEVLALTPADLSLEGVRPFVALKTLKQREKRARGRPRKDEPVRRLVPLLDADFAHRLRHYLVTFTGAKNRRIWSVTPQTVRNWLQASISRCEAAGIRFSIGIHPHIFRHSFAMHLLLWGRLHIKRLQSYLGHVSLESTEIYTRLLALDASANEPPLPFGVPVNNNPLFQLPDVKHRAGSITQSKP